MCLDNVSLDMNQIDGGTYFGENDLYLAIERPY